MNSWIGGGQATRPQPRAAATPSGTGWPVPGMAGHSYAYRLGGCCGHTRIRHLDSVPMRCTEIVRSGDIHVDGSTAGHPQPCQCQAWQEQEA